MPPRGKKKRNDNGASSSAIDGGTTETNEEQEEVLARTIDSLNPSQTTKKTAPSSNVASGSYGGKENDVFSELAARFVLNAPSSEIEDFNRLMFLVEQAHWYYLDFMCEQDKSLHSVQLKPFAKDMLKNVEALKSHWKSFDNKFEKFKQYKFAIPTCGAVLLNPTMDKCLMVRGWGNGNKTLGFPKGKMDANETEAECAAREVEEEIGVDIRQFIVEEDKVVFTRRRAAGDVTVQKNTLYLIQGISEETKFLTHTRKEISDIVWNPLWIFDQPDGQLKKFENKYWPVYPALRDIMAWVKKKKKKHPKPRTNQVVAPQSPSAGRAAPMSLEDLENELMSGYDDKPKDAEPEKPHKAFEALTNFKFDKSLILQPFVRR
jgi:mRNA-decapping enzyme subunit 2